MSYVVIDDHLLRDILSDTAGERLARLVGTHQIATTNLYYVRLCKSVVSAPGRKLTGRWPPEQRRALGQKLLQLPESIYVPPLRTIGFRVAELASSRPLSTLGAEAVAAAEYLDAPLCVWDGDDGPGIRSAARAASVRYRTVAL